MSEGKLKREYTEEELLKIAEKRIKVKRSLISHIASYVFVNLFLIFIYYVGRDFNFTMNGDMPWFLWIVAGWGLGVLFHISNTIQDLKYKYNVHALNKEIDNIQKNMDK